MNLLDLLVRYHSTYFKMEKGRVYRATIIVIKNLLSWTPDTAKKTKKKKKKILPVMKTKVPSGLNLQIGFKDIFPMSVTFRHHSILWESTR